MLVWSQAPLAPPLLLTLPLPPPLCVFPDSIETFVEVTEGMEIDRGYISPQFVNVPERLLVDYDNCRVLVTDQKIESVRDIVPILEQVTRLNSPLLIVAEDVTGGVAVCLVCWLSVVLLDTCTTSSGHARVVCVGCGWVWVGQQCQCVGW